jgi:hypothetical protein
MKRRRLSVLARHSLNADVQPEEEMRTGTKKRLRKQWYGIRSIFLFGRKKDGTNVFEERVVVFSGVTVEQAFAKAKKEAEAYAKGLNMKRHPYMEAYTQDGDTLIDGYEVWSVLYESREPLRSFFKNRYDKYEYHPEK